MQGIHESGHRAGLCLLEFVLEFPLDFLETHIYGRLHQDRQLRIEIGQPLIHAPNIAADLFHVV